MAARRVSSTRSSTMAWTSDATARRSRNRPPSNGAGVSSVMGVLVWWGARRFQLERRMLDGDLEVVGDTRLQVGQHGGGVTVVEAFVPDNHMRCQGGQPGGDLGGVQVMYRHNVRHAQEVLAHLVEVEPPRCRLQQNM